MQLALLVHGGAGLCDGLVLFLFRTEVDGLFVELDDTVHHFAVRGFDETEIINLCKDAKGGDKTNVRTFRGLDGAETAIVGIVHVTHLKACSLTGQTSRTEGRDTALVRQLRQRVGLVHELRQLVRAEEAVDDGRERFGVDKVDRGEDLVIAYVHLITDGAGHTGEAHAELVV